MTNSGNSPGRTTQRTALVHAGGRCDLRCVLCDCAGSASTDVQIARALQGGGARLVVRGPTENSSAISGIVADARRAGFAEIVLRTNAIAARVPAAAAALARGGADAVLVPLFSQNPAVHDRIAGRSRALLDALAGIKNLARSGLAVEIEVPILSPTLQNLEDVVRLVHKVAPSLRGVRFYVPPGSVPAVLATPAWEVGGPPLARALQLTRELGLTSRLSGAEGVPLCALRDFPDLHDVYAFNPKARASGWSNATFGNSCATCAVRPQCPGLLPAYFDANGEHGILPYAEKPALMYEQRTTRRRVWTREQGIAASRTELLVLRPTVNCNQDCTFCSANETSSNVWTDHETMLRAVARAARRRIHRLSFSGGEPTLSKHLVEYVRCASRLGVEEIEIVSNAVLLDRKPKVDALVAAGLTHAFISLHAHDESLSRQLTQKVDDFPRSVQGIKNLLAAGVQTALNHVITARGYPYLKEYVEFVRREFGGQTKISFAFVTPQFRALDNIEVMPRLSDVLPYLKRAMYRALEIGQPFSIGSRQGIPFCFLDEFRAWSDGFEMTQAALSEDGPQKQRAPLCDDCRFSDQCVGVWRPYAAKHGLGELRAVAGPKLSAVDVDQLRAFALSRPWGVPVSFDDVPSLVREPALEQGPPTVGPANLASPFLVQRSRPIRVLMLGSGRRARRIAREARGVSGLSIDAVASPHAPQADAHEFGGCPVYADAAAAMDDMRPEAVIIAAATDAHDQLARLALEQGIPALVEKPLTSTAEEGEALNEAVRAARGCIVPAHNSLFAAGLDELFEEPFARPAVTYVFRRTAQSGDSMRTWSRLFLYETIYHLLAVVGRGAGGGVGNVVQAAFRGQGVPESIRLELCYGDAPAEVVLDFTAAVEEDVFSRREVGALETELVWRRQGRTITIASAKGMRAVEASGNDVYRMLENFRDVVLDKAQPVTTIEEALDVMRTASRVVDAVAAAGAPFERASAPKHVSSRELSANSPVARP